MTGGDWFARIEAKLPVFVFGAFVTLSIASVAEAAPMSFGDLTAKSTLDQVLAKFPSAKRERICKGKTGNFANGPSLCDYVKVSEYALNGYVFEATFFFRPNSSLRTVSLYWPPIGVDNARPSEDQVRNAKLAMVELFASKYGSPLEKSICTMVDKNCTEWLVNGSDPYLGGDRIQIKASTNFASSRGVEITYEFANVSEYDRF